MWKRCLINAVELSNDKCSGSERLHTSHYFLIWKMDLAANCRKSSSRKKKEREMCMSALSRMCSLNQIPFLEGDGPGQLSGYVKPGRGFSRVVSGWGREL